MPTTSTHPRQGNPIRTRAAVKKSCDQNSTGQRRQTAYHRQRQQSSQTRAQK